MWVMAMSDGLKKKQAFEPGQWVEIDGMHGVARVLHVDVHRRRARVMLNDQDWVLALRRLRPTATRPVKPKPSSMIRFTGCSTIRHEIDLHGMRVEDAVAEVDYALDQAVVHRLTQIKIIHGHGTGAVRTAVRALLVGHPHVAHYRFGSPFEGGLACTIAEIRPARP